ncbi:twin-arginine translocation signal domain-containing protein [Natronococcus occultus]|uniref:Right handed beta helix domain-containing protein n=1 Tax=Natronococcus occultus SP4 TaxID=694430 RepID=L0K5D6_9EURY|nr:twin-arginine translocation signal domain-containing protein [Natronococcus occultus]AGB39594.1 hypothetical protein Natoc_3894 [Natronococcus occultus SP4]
MVNGSDAGERIATGTRTTDERSPNRRSFLRGTAVAGAAAFGLLGAGTTSGAASREGYDDVVDVVEAGADNTGSESITPVLEELRSDDTAFVFPEGRYYMDSQFRFTGFENVGFFGEDATLVPADYHAFDGPQTRLFRLGVSYNPGGRLTFDGFDVDQTAPDTGIRVIEASVSDRLEVRDITIRGVHDSGTSGPGLFALTDPEGTGVVERFRAPDGGKHIDETVHAGNGWRGPIGIEANTNVGHLEFRDCELGGFPDNGLYATNEDGTYVVEGGTFRNSNGANVRIGGSGSEIRGVTVEVDETGPHDRSQRPIRLETGEDLLVSDAEITITSPQPTSHALSVLNTCESAHIEDVDVDIEGEAVNHGIVISPRAGETTIRETTITHETAGGYPVWIRGADSRDRVLAEGLRVAGAAGDTAGFRSGIRCERNGCEFTDLEVDQPGRDGVDRDALVVTGENATVERATLEASRYPYVDRGADNLVRNAELESTGDEAGAYLAPEATGSTLEENHIHGGVRGRS